MAASSTRFRFSVVFDAMSDQHRNMTYGPVDAARILMISRQKLGREADAGRLGSVVVAGRRRHTWEHLRAWAEAHGRALPEQPPTEEAEATHSRTPVRVPGRARVGTSSPPFGHNEIARPGGSARPLGRCAQRVPNAESARDAPARAGSSARPDAMTPVRPLDSPPERDKLVEAPHNRPGVDEDCPPALSLVPRPDEEATAEELVSRGSPPAHSRDLVDRLDDEDDPELHSLADQLRDAGAQARRRQLRQEAEAALHQHRQEGLQARINEVVEHSLDGLQEPVRARAEAHLRGCLTGNPELLDEPDTLAELITAVINSAKAWSRATIEAEERKREEKALREDGIRRAAEWYSYLEREHAEEAAAKQRRQDEEKAQLQAAQQQAQAYAAWMHQQAELARQAAERARQEELDRQKEREDRIDEIADAVSLDLIRSGASGDRVDRERDYIIDRLDDLHDDDLHDDYAFRHARSLVGL